MTVSLTVESVQMKGIDVIIIIVCVVRPPTPSAASLMAGTNDLPTCL